ncbi:replication endonuclease [Photorhabdus kleinii]|uniref:replication endonuclease n=1 Tax=Photorhabdus kleinii TaxID=768034 RepID=UPI0021D4B6AA|nr:replication endonuclease [Photorhabdus kleinii]MCT8345185.1 replication endonuclease [Photorhabdus kleinii]
MQCEWAFSWNAPRPAIASPFFEDALLSKGEVTSEHPHVKKYLTRLIERDLLHSQVLTPAQQEARRQCALQEKQAYEENRRSWHETAAGVESYLNEQPHFIKSYFQKKIIWLRKNRGIKHSNAFLLGTVKSALLRLNAVREKQGVKPYCELASYYQGVYRHLAEMNKRRIKSLANEIAARINEMFCIETENANGETDDLTKADLLLIYRNLAAEVYSLHIMPPAWSQLKPIPGQSDDELDLYPALPAISRMINTDWWERQLWRLRCDWREGQLRAANQVNKKAHPYLSYEAVSDWQEQRRRNAEFFKAHDLVDEAGNVVSLENMVYASISNPVIRRHELMARMQGIEFVAQERGDVGVFYTITCPSKYHANNHSGHANPKWNHSTPVQAQHYLRKVWANIGSKLDRDGLRIYGFRVVEPHHDSTPHWHLLLFMRPGERKAVTDIMRSYAIKEDRQELGKRTSARFTAKKLDPKKGSATAYVAKYISKNIDGYALDGERDKETGKPLKETAKFAMAWASRYRIRQYQAIGTPPVTVWRELRKLSNQLTSVLKISGEFKRGKALLSDPQMDAVTAAADVGCFASYIMKQGGVLIPRKDYVVHLAYQQNDEPDAYGEVVDKIFGIWSPHIGEDSRVCTRLTKWKIVSKKINSSSNNSESVGLSFGSLSFSGPAAPWSSVNNSPVVQNSNNNRREIDRHYDDLLVNEFRQNYPTMHFDEKVKRIYESAALNNIEMDDFLARSLLDGGNIIVNDERYCLSMFGYLQKETKQHRKSVKAIMNRLNDKLGNPINLNDIFHDPGGHYSAMAEEAERKYFDELRG